MSIFRDYRIERDAEGRPCRMVWCGDYRKVPIQYDTCPKCEGEKLLKGRCLKCWGDWSRNTQWERV